MQINWAKTGARDIQRKCISAGEFEDICVHATRVVINN